MMLLLLLCCGAVSAAVAPSPRAAAEHDNFICSRSYGPGSYPLPCKPARDHWQSPFRNKFVITACEPRLLGPILCFVWHPAVTHESDT